jgi:hypothetical protein
VHSDTDLDSYLSSWYNVLTFNVGEVEMSSIYTYERRRKDRKEGFSADAILVSPFIAQAKGVALQSSISPIFCLL